MLVRSITPADLNTVHRLLVSNGWAHRVGDVEDLGRLISASQRALVAVADDQIVGFARDNYYGAYFRDPNGNKLCVACHAPTAEGA